MFLRMIHQKGGKGIKNFLLKNKDFFSNLFG